MIPSNKQIDSLLIDDESVLVGLFEDLESRINNLEESIVKKTLIFVYAFHEFNLLVDPSRLDAIVKKILSYKPFCLFIDLSCSNLLKFPILNNYLQMSDTILKIQSHTLNNLNESVRPKDFIDHKVGEISSIQKSKRTGKISEYLDFLVLLSNVNNVDSCCPSSNKIIPLSSIKSTSIQSNDESFYKSKELNQFESSFQPLNQNITPHPNLIVFDQSDPDFDDQMSDDDNLDDDLDL